MTPDVDEILRCWRRAICFADEVRLSTGERGTVIRYSATSMHFEIVAGPHGSGRKIVATRETLFPFWWPESQFNELQEGSNPT